MLCSNVIILKVILYMYEGYSEIQIYAQSL